MTSKHTMSGVTTKLRKLLQAMLNTGRGIIWQRSNGLDGERLEVFGSVATALKYILDNADDVVAALAPSEAVRCDAERYRYLRNVAEGKIGERHLNPPSISDWARNFDPRATYNIWTSYSLKGDDLDREIDAALKSINVEVMK